MSDDTELQELLQRELERQKINPDDLARSGDVAGQDFYYLRRIGDTDKPITDIVNARLLDPLVRFDQPDKGVFYPVRGDRKELEERYGDRLLNEQDMADLRLAEPHGTLLVEADYTWKLPNLATAANEIVERFKRG